MASLRAREVAIRLVFGGTPVATAFRIASDGLAHAAAGTTIRILISAGASRTLASLLAPNTSVDLAVAGAAIGMLVASVVAACLVAAIRVVAKDPAAVLREHGFT